jgi:hypothetical protein
MAGGPFKPSNPYTAYAWGEGGVSNPYKRPNIKKQATMNPVVEGGSWPVPLKRNVAPANYGGATQRAGSTGGWDNISNGKMQHNDRIASGSGIVARATASASRAVAIVDYGNRFEDKVIRHTIYGCVVCTIVHGGCNKTQDHTLCMESLRKQESLMCKSCLSDNHSVEKCPAKKHKRMNRTCLFCLRPSEYHKVATFMKCPTPWNDLLWNTVFLMMRYRNLEFRNIMQAGMGFIQGENGDVAKEEDVAEFLAKYDSGDNKGVNGFMDFFVKW